jgi:chitodextrinase
MAVPLYDHVVIVIEENHGFGDIIGSGSAPYINSLANGGALLTNYFAVDHPSEPNYMIIYAGSDFGIGDDKFHAEPDPSLATKVQAIGKTFVGYVQSGSPEKHNPWEAFPEGTSVEQAFSAFPTTSAGFAAMPALSFVIPNLNNDMHDGTIQQADTWLSNNIDAYAQWAKTHNSLLIITWDEDDSSGNNQVATIFYGANIVTGQYGATQYDHFSLCATLAALVGASPPRTSAAPIDGVYSATNVAPSVPTGLQTSSVTATSLTLSWTASTGSSPITYSVLDRVGGTGSFTTVASGISGTSRAVSGLTSSTTYNFEVTATGPGGTSAPSAVLSATTLAASVAPSVPVGLQASNVGSTGLTLSWNASTGTAPITYNVLDRVTGAGTFSSVATGISGTSTTISGLTAGTSYDLEVVATGPGGTSAPSAVLTVSTPTVTSAPSSPTGLQSSNVTTTSLTLSWNASIPPVKAITATGSGSTLNVSWTSPSAAPITYNVLDRITGTGNFSSAATGISGTSTTISGLTAGTSYDLEVVATSSDGTSAPSAVLTVTTSSVVTAPSVPTGLRATSVATTSLTLSWTASTGTGPITYNVLDRVTGTGSFTSVAGPSGTSTSISGLTANTSYDFEVIATGPGGTSAPSTVLTVTTLTTNVAPSVPTGLQASNITTTSAALSWSASTGTGPITYTVQSRISGTGSFVPVASGVSGTSTTINGLTANTNFDFEVIATGPGGTSAPSAVLTITTLASGGAEVIYVLEESLASTGPWTVVPGSPFTTTTDVVSGLSSGTGYFFRITAQDTILGISSTPTIVGPIVTASNSGSGESPQNARISSPSGSVVPPVVAITATGSTSPSTVGITGLNLSNTTVPSGAASGTVVGQITVQMSTGSFTGSLSLGGTNASLFRISGGNLVTASALTAGTYSITIIATQAGATNSPFTAPFSITAAANPAPAGAVFFDDFDTLHLYNTHNTSSVVTVAPNVVSDPNALWQPGPWDNNRDGHQQNQTWLTNPFNPNTANWDLYKCSNSTVQLTCEPTPSQYSSGASGAPLMGGYMTTFGRWQRRFGYWEAKLKVGPIVNGIGVEWWLWNTGSDNSEIDILESFDNFTSQTVHPGSGPSVYWNGFDGVVDPTVYHTWAADWQSGYVRCYHDNVKYVDTSPNGFGTEMFMFMTCDDFSDWNGSVDTGGPPVTNTVDYVVVYPTKP